MNSQIFFATHPVFTVPEFDQFLRDNGRKTEHNRQRLLGYHHRRGRLVLVRPGLYASVPSGYIAAAYPVDSYLVAAYLTQDALIGYHSALAFHGVAHSRSEERIIITKHPLTKPLLFRGIMYKTVRPPASLVNKHQEGFGTQRQDRQGEEVRVTTLERTLVDALDRPRLGGGWEEIWRSYEAVPYLDLNQVVQYALLLDNATTIARVGYFLATQRDRWMVSEEYLAPLRSRRPCQPHYLDRKRKEPAHMVREWNLIVPETILERAWEETGEPIA